MRHHGSLLALVLAPSLLAAFLFTGCAGPRQNAPPPEFSTAAKIDLANHGEYRPVPPAFLNQQSTSNYPADRRLQVLALSGGGKFGAYSTGVLNGWTKAGTRPTFDVVTGVSTGALIATFAYLGSQYDDHLKALYTTLRTRDVVRRRPLLGLLGNDAAFSSAPLADLIDQQVTDELLCEVRAAHLRGRRLFVATTNLDTSRPVIWDLGAVAASNRPDRREHFRDVLLASASVPGALPPVRIPVTYNGVRYVELHGDGAATQELFLRATLLGIDTAALKPGDKPLAGSDLYVIVSGKLYPEPKAVDPRTIKLGAAAGAALMHAQTRNDLARLYTLSMVTGMRYHYVALAADVPASSNSLDFDPDEMRRLFDAGYCDGVRQAWRGLPPEAGADDQLLPRKGTDFHTPIVTHPR